MLGLNFASKQSLNLGCRSWEADLTPTECRKFLKALTIAGSFAGIVLALSPFARAMDSTEVLPEAINSPSVRIGFVSGIGFRFLSSGDLMSLNDINSIEFDAKALSAFEPRVNELVGVLNQFGNQRLGDQLSLGTLKLDTDPKIKYYAPVFAHGINARWTVAVGIPVVSYTNKISMTQSRGNVEEIRAQIGNASPEINAAFNDLSVNLATVANQTLEAKGYKPIRDREETQLGDLNVASLIEFAKRDNASGQYKLILTLPTGKGNDPDDLADIGAFGYTAIENQLTGNYLLGRLQLAGKAGYRYTLPDRVVRRVPMSESDTLPGIETKQTVERSTGGAVFGGGSLTYRFSDAFNVGLGIERTLKDGDRYSGSSTGRYDLLGKDTNSETDRLRVGLNYSTIESFLAGTSLLPTMIAYEFSDTIRGVNTERMTVHEIWLQLFF